MKKWIALGLACVSLFVAVILIGGQNQPVSVTVAEISPRRVEQTVTCTGVVEASGGLPVVVPVSCVVQSVDVSEGQQVKKGERLASVDLTASRAVAKNEEDLLALAAIGESVTAPQDGIVVGLSAESGALLTPETPFLMLVREQDLQLKIAIREKHLKVLGCGMTVRVSGDGFRQKSYTGVLQEISSAAQTGLNGTPVIHGLVSLEKPDSSLRLGLSARAAVVTSVKEDGLVVPYEAVLSDEEGSYVYVVRKGKAYRKTITVAAHVTDGVLLKGEEMAKQQVVCQPDKVTGEGMSVEVIAP